MDVTFTNVLEGARQYFQGLPTGTNAAPGGGGGASAYPSPVPDATPDTGGGSTAEAPPPSSSSSYWQQQYQPQYQQQENHFQFSRPQSRETQYHQQTQQQVQRVPTSQYHQLQNVAYYQPKTQYYQPNGQNQTNVYYKHLYTPHAQTQAPAQPQYQKQQSTVNVNVSTTQGLTQQAPSMSVIGYSRPSNQKAKVVPPKPSTSRTQSYQQEVNYQNRLPFTSYGTTTTSNYQAQAQVQVQAQAQSSQSQYYQKPANQNGRVVPIVKQKRESPLDLSVKTVRTPADSTLDDDKYYRTQNYNYEMYQNSYQRVRPSVVPPASAPKVEFHPNFNVQINQNYRTVDKTQNQRYATARYPTVSVPTAAHVNSFIQKSALPRVDYQPQNTLNMYQVQEQKKRPADSVPSVVPNKITKIDTWKQRLDQQIEQRFNTYQQQQQKNKMLNGNNYQQQQQVVPTQYQHQNQNQNRQYQYHNQTYVPSATAHQYPGYQYQQTQQTYKNIPISGSKPMSGADKRVISLLRNSLEIKTAKEAQKKLEQEQRYDTLHKSRLDIQHPSTDVTAPLQPKPGFINRHNVSPFTPTNLPDNSHLYKLHIPKAIDSVNFESEGGHAATMTNQNADLDGLAALVAARIRTKAELKQVGNENPAKASKERDKEKQFAPRRRLFSRSEEDGSHMRGLRSSSETSVFDFPDTDSEGEMPVLERQTLEDMRRDRRSSTKPPESISPTPVSSSDDAFAQACDSFVEQLKTGSGKKRGRRKKLEPEVLAQLETVTKEKPIDKDVKEEDDDSDVPLINCKKKLSVSLNDLNDRLAVRPAKKPVFGDGSHFYPGWEEEVYKYKKSLRMPPSLIHVTRPPQYHRLSTSLPDLDPQVKCENLDSDNESNQSFNVKPNTYDSEGNGNKESILDRLLEKYGGRKKKKKRKEEPKVLPSQKEELLKPPTNVETFKVFLNTKDKQKRVTMKEVFGEDRPASAPPVTCVDSIKIKEEPEDDDFIKKEDFSDTRQVLKNKLLNRGRKENLLKTLVDKKIKSELLEDDDDDQDSKSETPSIDGDENQAKKRSKFRNIRRKFSSGFDYIRKKKKQKKEESENVKPKNKGKFTCKSNPGSVQDIQKEIKGWVLNKGIGETILHRAARLGYTDITAYCLEKMECSPSPKDNAGYTPLHEASTKGNLAIAKMLLMYGANVSESARGGIRPLHEAVENGYVEIVRLLLSYGADPMLATYSGMTPLALSSDDVTSKLLQSHIDDIEGNPGSPWNFSGPASCFDPSESGFDVLAEAPVPDALSDEEDVDFEVSDSILPNLYTLRGEPPTDRWVLLQDLSGMLKVKSRDALLRQICPTGSGGKSFLRELKMSEFLEQAHCCQFLNIGEKVNTRASKIALIKYTDKVRELLNVEKVTISVR